MVSKDLNKGGLRLTLAHGKNFLTPKHNVDNGKKIISSYEYL